MRSISFIGAGRLCTTLATLLDRNGQSVIAVASRTAAKAQGLAASLRDCRCSSLAEAARADLVFITVPDDDIDAVTRSLEWHPGQWVVHCSGATEVSALDSAARSGASTGGFHPLQSFSDPIRAIDILAGSTVAIEASGSLETYLYELARLLALHPIRLPAGARALYHGGASFSATFLLTMLDESLATWKSFGVDEADALRALLPVARGNLEAAAGKGLSTALAGPIVRGDTKVVARHLSALQALSPERARLYRDMAQRQVDLAVRGGRLDALKEDAMRRVIQAGN